MRYPVNNWATEWNGTAGYGFGDVTAYGRHDGVDINDNGGGNSDLGKPLFAISKGKVVGIHKHTGAGNFGNHFFLQIDGKWGTRYVHYAHCLELNVTEGQEVEEGYQVAKVGNSGTTYAHCHFAIKKRPSGMDDVANTKAELEDIWEDPIAFIERYLDDSAPVTEIPDKSDVIRRVYKGLTGEWGSESEVKWRVESGVSIDDIIIDIINGDGRFYNLHIKPVIEAKTKILETDLKALKRDFDKYKQAHNDSSNSSVEVTTITYPMPESPKTADIPPSKPVTIEWPPINSTIANFLKDLTKKLGF